MKSLVAEGMHYIRTADGLEELYLLNSDPEERSNLAPYSVRLGASPAIPSQPVGDAQEAITRAPAKNRGIDDESATVSRDDSFQRTRCHD